MGEKKASDFRYNTGELAVCGELVQKADAFGVVEEVAHEAERQAVGVFL